MRPINADALMAHKFKNDISYNELCRGRRMNMKGCTKKQLEKFTEFCLKGALNGHFDKRSAMLILMAAWDFLELGELQIIEKPDGTFDVKEKEIHEE